MTIQITNKQLPVAPTVPPGPRMLALREKTKANLVWRFYRDTDCRWRWQHLSAQRELLAESTEAYKNYKECLADAQGKGYVSHRCMTN